MRVFLYALLFPLPFGCVAQVNEIKAGPTATYFFDWTGLHPSKVDRGEGLPGTQYSVAVGRLVGRRTKVCLAAQHAESHDERDVHSFAAYRIDREQSIYSASIWRKKLDKKVKCWIGAGLCIRIDGEKVSYLPSHFGNGDETYDYHQLGLLLGSEAQFKIVGPVHCLAAANLQLVPTWRQDKAMLTLSTGIAVHYGQIFRRSHWPREGRKL